MSSIQTYNIQILICKILNKNIGYNKNINKNILIDMFTDENGNYNCTNCENCYDCVNCVNCKNCINCVNCKNCINCLRSRAAFSWRGTLVPRCIR